MTKVHKLIVMVIDHDDLGAEGVCEILESTRYPNHCIGPSVMSCETHEVEWSDNHPLNNTATVDSEFRKLFGGAP